jgi:serine/threonine protein kinase
MTPEPPLPPDEQQPTVAIGGERPPRVGAKGGDSIGPFKILSIIGEGGFGVVYLAQQTSPVRRDIGPCLAKSRPEQRSSKDTRRGSSFILHSADSGLHRD